MLKWKTNKIGKEFLTLESKNPPLAAMMKDLADFVHIEYRKDVLMTHIFRTKNQQKQLYAQESAKKQQGASPHMRWEAVDIRDRLYTEQEKSAIGSYLKEYYDKTNELAKLKSGSRTYWLHAIKGGAMHFHIQYRGSLVYVFNQGAIIRGRPDMNSNTTRKSVSIPNSGK